MTVASSETWKGFALALALWIVVLLALESLGLSTLEGVLWRDGDSLRHIATGDLMITQSSPVPADPWSFATEEQEWFNPSWFFNVSLSLIYQTGGFWGVTLAATLAAMLALALPVLVATRYGASFPLTALLAIPAAPLFLAGIAVRPQLMTLLFIPLTVALLWQGAQRGWLKLAEVGGLVLLLLFWVNAHGGWPVYFTLVGLWFVRAVLWQQLKLILSLGLTLFLSFSVSLCNPLGFAIYTHLFNFFDRQPLTSAINEWQPLDPATHWLFLPFLLLFGLALLSQWRVAWKTPLIWAALFWLVLSLGSIRHLHVFAPLGLMATAWLLAGPESKLSLNSLRQLPSLSWRTQALALFPAILLAVLALPWFWNGVKLSDAYTLAPEAAYLRERHPQAKVFNAYNLGGALVFQLRGEPKIWIDDRAETLYGRDDQAIAVGIQQHPRLAPNMAWASGATVAIFPKDSRAAKAFASSSDWKPVFTGETATIFRLSL